MESSTAPTRHPGHVCWSAKPAWPGRLEGEGVFGSCHADQPHEPMKQMIYHLLYALILVACSAKSERHSAINPSESSSQNPDRRSVASQLTVEELWKLAVQYSPTTINLTFADYLGNHVLASTLDTSDATVRLAIGLVLLKQYNHLLTCCNQSYNLFNQSNPSDSLLVATFTTYSACSAGNRMFMPSSCAYEWMTAQRGTIRDEQILALFNEVDANIRRLKL